MQPSFLALRHLLVPTPSIFRGISSRVPSPSKCLSVIRTSFGYDSGTPWGVGCLCWMLAVNVFWCWMLARVGAVYVFWCAERRGGFVTFAAHTHSRGGGNGFLQSCFGQILDFSDNLITGTLPEATFCGRLFDSAVPTPVIGSGDHFCSGVGNPGLYCSTTLQNMACGYERRRSDGSIGVGFHEMNPNQWCGINCSTTECVPDPSLDAITESTWCSVAEGLCCVCVCVFVCIHRPNKSSQCSNGLLKDPTPECLFKILVVVQVKHSLSRRAHCPLTA